MKDKEIIKALELCIQVDSDVCDKCPFYDEESGCLGGDLRIPALDLINRQKAENEELQLKNSEFEIELEEMRLWKNLQQAEIKELQKGLDIWIDIAHRETLCVEQAKAEAIKDFAEEVERRCVAGGIYPAFVRATIKRVKEEMTDGDDI